MSVEQLRQRFSMYLEQTYNTPRHRSGVLVSGGLVLLGVVILLLCAILGVWQAASLGVILAAAGGYRLYRMLRPQRMFRRMREVAQRGVPVTAYVVQANSVLHVPGNMTAFALVAFSFDPRGHDAQFMVPIVQRLQRLKGGASDEPEAAALARRITSEKAEFYHRERIPRSLTGEADVDVSIGDILIQPSRLRERYLDRAALLCLAEPGDRGGIELIPDWLLDEARRTDSARESGARASSPLSRN